MQVEVLLYCPGYDPPRVIVEIVSDVLPVFVKVKSCPEDVVFSVCTPNDKLDGLTDATGVGGGGTLRPASDAVSRTFVDELGSDVGIED
jgi:hypothetical protein